MPSRKFYEDWLNTDEEFARQYARAREAQAEYYADEIVAIADAATPETANAARLQVDARKWVAAKLLPKKYGDKANETHVTTSVNVAVVPDSEIERIRAATKAALQP
jgi:hypothetical protein